VEEYGCFEASFDRVSEDVRRAVFGSLEELFELPLETKLRNAYSNKPSRGYVGQHPLIPVYESLGIDDAHVPESVESFTNTLWPQGNSSFSKTMQSYFEQLSELDKIVRKMIVESFDLEKYMDEHISSTNYLLRFMKYDSPNTPDAKLGLSPHTDNNTVTILHQNQVEGLEVQTKDGRWINIQPSPTSFIVIIGEALRAWLNGRLYSPRHRVMMYGNETRYSLGLFSTPKSGYVIQTPKEMVDEKHPLLFKPYDHEEFMSFYYTEAGQRAPSALQAYCGI
ncbi:unnamed protein product, partial [Linum tenue]